MELVSLSLDGLTKDVDIGELQSGLAKLYGKPESHFTMHCKHLYELHTPCVLLKKVSRTEAEKHRVRLEALGIKTGICDYVDPSSLSLVPVSQRTEKPAECPACNQTTTNSEMCSECGVMIKKFLQQQSIDNNMRSRLVSADKNAERVEKIQESEQRRRQEAAEKRKEREKNAELNQTPPPEDDHFTVEVEDTAAKKVAVYAVAAVVMAVFGSGYFMYQLKDKIDREDIYDYSTTTDANAEATLVATNNAVPVAVQPEAPKETGVFSDWTKKIDDAERLKNNLTVLNNSVGMSSTMDGLVLQNPDPFVRIIGTQKLVKLRVQDDPVSLLKTENDVGEKYSDVLANSATLIKALPSKNEQLYTRLSLARLYGELQMQQDTDILLEQAKQDMIDISDQDDTTEQLIAEVISAEYFAEFEAGDKMSGHYSRAVQLAEQLDPNTSEGKWSIPFIVRSQARSEQYVSAYELLDTIDDPQVSEIVMSDISAYAQIDDKSIEELVFQSDGGDIFANDAEMQFLLENQKTMKQNAGDSRSFRNWRSLAQTSGPLARMPCTFVAWHRGSPPTGLSGPLGK